MCVIVMRSPCVTLICVCVCVCRSCDQNKNKEVTLQEWEACTVRRTEDWFQEVMCRFFPSLLFLYVKDVNRGHVTICHCTVIAELCCDCCFLSHTQKI